MSIEVMKQALETLEDARLYNYALKHKATDNLITSLRQVIDQAEKQKPVAWMGVDAEGNPNKFRLNKFGSGIPLYTKDGDL